MKPLKLIALAAFALLFAQCKTTSPTSSSGPTPSLMQIYSGIDSGLTMLYNFGSQNGGNGQQAMMKTAAWMKTQPNVQSVTVIDSTFMNIQMKSGLITSIFLDQIGADSLSLFRGGGGSRRAKPVVYSRNRTLSTNTITNKDALFWLPVEFEFYKDPSQVLHYYNLLEKSPVPVKYNSMTRGDCTPQSIETFKNYGVVIMDTHGCPDAFLAGNTIVFTSKPANDDEVKRVVIGNVGQDTYNKLFTGEVRLAFHVRISNLAAAWQAEAAKTHILTLRLLVTTKYIDELPDMPATIVFGNMCYSGATVNHEGFTKPMANAWLGKNPISYYGFATDDGVSAPVDNGFSKVVLDAFLTRLAINTDSTEVANLAADGSEYVDPDTKDLVHPLYFRHFGNDDYSYAKCGDPITDARDGQVYKTVCIGKTQWMAQNLNYDAAGSYCYENDASNCSTYGRLYDWSTLMQGAAASSANPSGVQGVCPKGWHVPSLEEWSQLIIAFGGNQVAGGPLKDTILWKASSKPGTNSSGFSMLPAGVLLLSPTISWSGIGVEASFGTASSDPSNTANPYYWIYVPYDAVNIVSSASSPYLATSCRCVKDP